MKKKLPLLLLGGMFLLVLIQCKKKEETPPDPQIANNVVNYQFNVTGDYSGLNIVYYKTGSVREELTNPTMPWQMTFTNFVTGDSAYFHATCLIPIHGTATVTWMIGVGNGTQFTYYETESTPYPNVPDVTPVEVVRAYKIP